jgi:hypothetical protein
MKNAASLGLPGPQFERRTRSTNLLYPQFYKLKAPQGGL